MLLGILWPKRACLRRRCARAAHEGLGGGGENAGSLIGHDLRVGREDAAGTPGRHVGVEGRGGHGGRGEDVGGAVILHRGASEALDQDGGPVVADAVLPVVIWR